MRRHDAQDAELLVFTFKQGLLSRVAHDLKIRAARFDLEVDDDGARVELTCPAGSLRVVNAVLDGREAPELLSVKNKSEIELNIVKDVLHAQAHPEIRFVSTRIEPRPDGHLVRGDLTLHGTTRPIEAEVARVRGRLEAELLLDQRDFGITPYSALFGALKVKPEVRVRLSIPDGD